MNIGTDLVLVINRDDGEQVAVAQAVLHAEVSEELVVRENSAQMVSSVDRITLSLELAEKLVKILLGDILEEHAVQPVWLDNDGRLDDWPALLVDLNDRSALFVNDDRMRESWRMMLGWSHGF